MSTPDTIATDSASLLAAGFIAVRYEGQDGIFYRRDTSVASMPYLGQQIDDEFIFESSVVCTEVTPNGYVQVMISDTDYVEEAVRADSEEGQAALKDSASGTLVMSSMEGVLRA